MPTDTSGIDHRPDVRPIPDPTYLTTQQLTVAVLNLKELIDTKFQAMDKAVALLQDAANRSPTINEVYVQHEERFKSIAVQFSERDTRTEQTSRDSKVAVDAALQAAKEAVGEQNRSNALAITKSETAFTKQIDQMGAQLNLLQKGLDDKIDDLKLRLNISDARITSMEGRGKGGSEMWGFVIGVIGVIGIIVGIVVAFGKH